MLFELTYIGIAMVIFGHLAYIWNARSSILNFALKTMLTTVFVFAAVTFYALIDWYPLIPPYTHYIIAMCTAVGLTLGVIWNWGDAWNVWNRLVGEAVLFLGLAGIAILIPPLLAMIGSPA